MFENCENLRTVEFTNDDGEQVAPNAIYMTNMFRNCYSLDSLDLSHFGKLDWIVDMDGLLENCTSLQKLNIDNLDNSRIGPTNNNHGIWDDYAYSMTNSWTENPVTSQIGSYQYGRDLGLKSCTSLKTISAKNSNVWMCKNNRGLPGNEYFDASSEESMYYFTQNQMTFYPDAVDGLTVEIKTKRNYVDLLTDRDGNPENMPSFDGPEDIADRGTNINIVYGDLNLNGPGHLPAGVYTISDSGWIEYDVTPDTESYYRITNIVTKEGGGWYLPNITGGSGVLGEELVQRYDRFYDEDGNWHDAIQINTISQEWPASGDYVISLEESPLVFTYNDAALDVNGKRHNVSIAINKITFKNLERFPAIPDPYTLIHNDNHYYDDGWNNEYFRPVLRVATGERLTFMNYAYKGDPLGSSYDQYRILTNGSGTEIEYTVTIDGANPNTTFVFNSNDLDIPATQGWENYQDHCYDKLTIDSVTYGRNGESVILGEGNHLGTITFAENTGLTVVDGNKVVTTGSDPSTSWSEFAVLANATGATYTWVSGIACTSYGPRDTKPLSIGRIAINPTVRKEFDGTLASGQFEFLLEADGNQEQPTTVPDVPQTKSNDASGLVVFDPIILEKTEEDGVEYGYRSSFIEYPELYYPGTNPDNNHSGEGEHNQFTYWFKIKEIIPDPRDPQIVYDETEHTLTVKVRPPENDAELAKGILAEFFLDGSEVPFDSVWSKVDATVNLATFVNRKDIVTVSVNKFWDDEENIDGSRPSSIFVQLYVDGDPSGDPVTLDESNQWQTVFPNLTKYKDRTTYTEYVYTVMESGIPACYDAEYETSSDNGTTTIAITNRYIPERVDAAFTKIWNDAGNQDGLRPASVQFGLFKNDELVSDSVKTISVTGNTDIYTGTFQNLLAKENGVPVTYTVKEFSPVSGTWISEGAFDQHYTASVTAGNNVFTFTNTHEPARRSITVTKSWNDEGNRHGIRPQSVTVQLYADGDPLTSYTYNNIVTSGEQTLTGGSWAYTWENLPVNKTGEVGRPVQYTVSETSVPEGYTLGGVTGSMDGGFTVTNDIIPVTVSITANKVWDDGNNQDGVRPSSVQAQLYADGTPVGDGGIGTLDESNSWSYTWSGLDKYRAGGVGEEIVYSVKEHGEAGGSISFGDQVQQSGTYPGIPRDYTVTYSTEEAPHNGSVTITNSYVPDSVEIVVRKHWIDDDDNDGFRPESLKVQLYAGDNPEITLTAGNGWTGTFGKWPRFNQGEEIEYVVAEDDVEKYVNTIAEYNSNNDFTVTTVNITNTHTPETVDITVYKHWDDNDNADGLRAPVTVQLFSTTDVDAVFEDDPANEGWTLRGEKTIGSLADYGSVSWQGLPKYHHGALVRYAIREKNTPADYVSSYAGGMELTEANNHTDTITNRHLSPVSVTLHVQKKISGREWFGDDDFHIALIPRPETNPMPADVHSVGGIFHSSVRIDNSDEHVSDSVRADAFAPVTFTMADLGGKPDTTFTYALRELTPEHLGEARIPGVTYTAKRFIVEVKLEEGVNNSLKATVTYYATTTHNEVEVIDSVVQVPVFTNRYDESSVLYHPRAEKSLLHLGVPALQNGDFEFRLRPVGDNAAIAPMPANTTGSGADRVLTVHNIGNSVRFFEDDSDGLLFSHTGLREHFTDDELIDGVTFSYQMSEVVPAGAVNHDDGTLSLKAGGVETVYDALVHFRQFNIRLDTVGGNFQLLQTYSDDPVHHEYFLKADGDTVFVGRHDAQGEPRHGNGMPIFRNFRIADTVVTVHKSWTDFSDALGLRPASVTVKLLADGDSINYAVLGSGNGWEHTFAGLPTARINDTLGLDTIRYSIAEVSVDNYVTSVSRHANSNRFTVTNTLDSNIVKKDTSILVRKTWVDPADTEHPDITFVLNRNGEPIAEVTLGNGETEHTFANLPYYNVRVNGEVVVTNGTLQPYLYTVEELPVNGYTSTVSGGDVTNTIRQERTTVSGRKTWVAPAGTVHPDITVVLLRDGQKIDSAVIAGTTNASQSYSFTNLPVYDVPTGGEVIDQGDGHRFEYTVIERPVEGYTSAQDGFDFTNTINQEYTEIPVRKVWDDAGNQDGYRPQSVTLTLTGSTPAHSQTYSMVLTGDGDTWDSVFKDLPVYDDARNVIAYTLSEPAIPGQYASVVNGYTVTNTHTPETIDIAGAKTWDDADNQDGKRPASITIRLKADGAEVANKTVTAADGWSWSFTGKPKYANGTEIAYTVTEDAVTGYTASVSGYNVTNTHTPDSVLVRVTKFWNDHHNNDLYRPGSITVHLVDDGDVLATRTLNGSSTSNEWEADFGKWPRRRNGTEIVYDLQEENFQFSSMYLAPTVERETTDDETLYWMRLTNTHPLDSIDLSVTKLWEDNNNTEHLRTDIQVQLYRNNGDNHSIFEPDQIDETGNYYWTPVGEPKTIAVGSGTATWQRMPLYHNGVKFNYAVKELTVPAGYTASYSDQGILNETNDYAVTITNKHVQPVTTGDIPAVRKKLLGRSWLETDTFVMALVPQLSTQPMPTTINTVEGIVYAPLAITRNNTFISDSVRQGVFAPITFTMDDMAGSTEKTFTYHIRELTAVEANLERLTGITYASERYEVDITVKEVDNALVINNVEYYPVTSEHDTEIRQDEVDIPVFVNRYNDSVTIYRMVANKQLTIIGLEDTLATGDYSFILRPVGANAAVAPMPAETVGSGADRSLTVTNEGNAIRFYDDNITDDGLVFAYQNLISSGFTDNDLRNGVEFEYELHEVIPEGCTFNHDGTATWSRSVTREDGLMVDEIYDAVVHYRSVVVTMEERSNRIILHVVGSEDSHLTDYYLDNGDTMYLEPSILAHRHSEGGVPIFHNARIARISLTVEKFWDDFDNALGTRPETVTLTLMADGVATDSVVVLGEANGWSHTFQNIPAVTSLGDHITYTVEETPVNHYEVTYDGNMTEGMYVLNTLVSYGDDEQCAIIVDRDQLNPCSEMPCPATVADADGNSYAVVKIDGYCWMAENLRTWTPEAKSYVSAVMPDEAANVSTFGYLYTWHDAAGGTDNPEQIDGHVRGICPIGWHLPTAAEINVLRTNTAEELSSTDLWLVMNGTNTSGFNARPAGYYNGTLQRFEDCLTSAWFHGDTPQSVFHISYHCCYVFPNIDAQQNAFSVRCVKDCE